MSHLPLSSSNRPQHPRIVLCYPVEAAHLEAIRAAAPHCEIIDAGQEGIGREILDADIFCGHAKVPVPWERVVAQGRLRWIQSSAAGMDHCLVPEVIASDILVSSASGLFAAQVAEQTLALLLALLRRLPDFCRAQQQHVFERLPTDDLRGKTVGIVGLGGNGRRLVDVLAPFGVRLIATDLFPVLRPTAVSRLDPADRLPELLREADVVILCVPLNEQTHHLINESALQQMKRGSYLINVARGPVVDERALIEALESDHLAGAGLDVTEVEPLPRESRLWDLPQVLITPHVGAQAADRVTRATEFFCDNLRRYFAGERVWNCVDKRLGFPLPDDHAGLKALQRS